MSVSFLTNKDRVGIIEEVAQMIANNMPSDGVGIVSIDEMGGDAERTTYRINLSNDTYYEYTVYNGYNGKDGNDGADGVSITSVVQTTTSTADGGTNVITVTLSNGQSFTFNVKNGSKGSAGKDGTNGTNGVGISTIKQTTTSSADGGNNVFTVTLTNGQTATFTVKNGSKGSTGSNGKDGATPVKGVDYFTPSDIAEIVTQVKNSLTAEEWELTLESGSTVTRKVMLA